MKTVEPRRGRKIVSPKDPLENGTKIHTFSSSLIVSDHAHLDRINSILGQNIAASLWSVAGSVFAPVLGVQLSIELGT